MVFFVDRDLGAKRFPGLLKAAGVHVERHADHFPDDAPDEVWIPDVASRGWWILSSDKKIQRRPTEREAVIAAGAGLFVLVGGHAKAEDLAKNFINTLPKVEEFVREHAPPFIAKVYRPSPLEGVAEGKPGRVELRYPLEEG